MRKLNANDRVLVTCLAVFAGMIAATYASVPLYRIFCRATGFDGTPQIAEAASQSQEAGMIAVRFDANVGQGLAWKFAPKQNEVTVHLGENKVIYYRAENDAAMPTIGTATFNVTPEKAAPYFNKIACFCFTKQELKAGQSADLGVSFFVDPRIATDPETRDVTAITLSYTFFPAKPDTQTVAAATPQR